MAKDFTILYNSYNVKLPSRNILILTSICVVLILCVVAVKLRYGNIVKVPDFASLDYSADSNPSNMIDQAIQASEISALGGTTTAQDILSNPNDTLTDKLSKNLFTNYMAMQADDGSVDNNSQTNIVNGTLSNITPPAIDQKYPLSNLTTFIPKNSDDLHSYGNLVIQTIQNTLLTAKDVSTNSDGTPSNDNIIVYKKIAEALIKIKTPSALSFDFVSIINNYYSMYTTLDEINNYAKDPLKGLLAIKQYQAITQSQTTLFTDMASYFKNNGIIFSNNEPGNAWNIVNSGQMAPMVTNSSATQ